MDSIFGMVMIRENKSPKLTNQLPNRTYPFLRRLTFLLTLVTLLLGNVIVNETLPVVLDSELGGGVTAILISTFLIVVFGE